MIIDASALIAILRNEAEGERVQSIAVLPWPARRISAPTLVETGIVIDAKGDPRLTSALSQLQLILNIEVVPFEDTQVAISRQAYREYGKGSGHKASLNFGDTFSYALASISTSSSFSSAVTLSTRISSPQRY